MELDKERRVSSPVEQPEPPPSAQEEKTIPPGGRLVTVFFLIFGGVFLQQSLALWARESSCSIGPRPQRKRDLPSCNIRSSSGADSSRFSAKFKVPVREPGKTPWTAGLGRTEASVSPGLFDLPAYEHRLLRASDFWSPISFGLRAVPDGEHVLPDSPQYGKKRCVHRCADGCDLRHFRTGVQGYAAIRRCRQWIF